MRAGATLSGLKWHGNDSYHTQLHLVSQRQNGLKLLHSKIAFQAPRSKSCWGATSRYSRLLCNPKVHYRFHKGPPPVAILSHVIPVHLHTISLIIYFNTILPSTSRSSERYLPFSLASKFCYYFSSFPYTTWWPNTLTLFRKMYITWRRSLSNFLQPPVTSSLYILISSSVQPPFC